MNIGLPSFGRINRAKVGLALALSLMIVLLQALGGPARAQGNGGEDLVVAITADPRTFDPQASSDYDNHTVNQLIYRNLYVYDADFFPQPDLALNYTVSESGLDWTFELRDDVYFQDGSHFTSEDVVATFERVLDPSQGLAHTSSFSFISAVSASEPYSVTFTTENPYAPLLGVIAAPYGGILSAEAANGAAEDVAVNPVGTGPYRLKERVVGERVVLERFDDYAGPTPGFDEITFITVPEEQTRVAMLTRGDIDVAVRISPFQLERLEADPNVSIIEQFTNAIFAPINVTAPPLNDKRVRQAMNYAIDKELLVNAIFGGKATAASAMQLPMVFGVKDYGDLYAYDPERARELLSEAGVDGFTLEFVAPQGRYLFDRQVAEAIAQQLREIGIDVQLQLIGDWSTYVDTVWAAEQDLSIVGWGAGTGDLDTVLFRTLHSAQSGSPWNLGHYENDQVDSLIEEGRTVFDVEARREVYSDLQDLLVEDAPWIFLHYETSFTGVRADVDGVVVLASGLIQLGSASRQ